MTTTTTPYDDGTPEAYAYTLGADHGTAAQSWVDIDSNDAARILRDGIADGDPEVLDTLPYPDLSGQWADTMTGPRLLDESMPDASDDERMDAFDEVCQAYELGYNEAVEREITARCTRYLLG